MAMNSPSNETSLLISKKANSMLTLGEEGNQSSELEAQGHNEKGCFFQIFIARKIYYIIQVMSKNTSPTQTLIFFDQLNLMETWYTCLDLTLIYLNQKSL